MKPDVGFKQSYKCISFWKIIGNKMFFFERIANICLSSQLKMIHSTHHVKIHKTLSFCQLSLNTFSNSCFLWVYHLIST